MRFTLKSGNEVHVKICYSAAIFSLSFEFLNNNLTIFSIFLHWNILKIVRFFLQPFPPPFQTIVAAISEAFSSCFCNLFLAVLYVAAVSLAAISAVAACLFCSHFCSHSMISFAAFSLQFFIAACLFCSHFCSRSMCFAAISAVAAFCLAAIFFAVLQSQHVFCSHFCSRSIFSRGHFFCSFLSQLVCFAAISAVAACVLQPFLQSQHFVSQPFFV